MTDSTGPDDLRDLFDTPGLYVADIAIRNGEASAACMRMTRETYSASNFLDQRTVSVDQRLIDVQLARLAQAYRETRPPSRPIAFIEHTAFCGSTLLSRLLDVPGSCLPYREPFLLHRLADFERYGMWSRLQGQLGFSDPHLLDLTLALLARTYGEAEKPVVKLTDSCTSLCPEFLSHDPGSRILLLYHDLEHFLVAMLKDGSRRAYVRAMLGRARADLGRVGRGIPVSFEGLSDARCVAYVWLGLMYPYLNILAACPERVRTLNASRFFRQPRDHLVALIEFFGLDISAEQLDRQLSAGIMGRDSKRPDRSFERARYQSDLEEMKASLRREIADATKWVETVTAGATIPDPLPCPLIDAC